MIATIRFPCTFTRCDGRAVPQFAPVDGGIVVRYQGDGVRQTRFLGAYRSLVWATGLLHDGWHLSEEL